MQALPRTLLLAALAATLASLGCNRHPTESTAAKHNKHYEKTPAPPPPAKFDYYVLNMSWEPEFCATHRDAAECKEKRGFVLHGLWPQNNDGSYPENCAQEPGLKSYAAFKDLNPDERLLEHEWQKHGTCSGLSAEAYMEFTRKAVKQLAFPPIITSLKQEDTLQTERIINRFEAVNPTFPTGSIALSCGNNRLTAVQACMTKDLTPVKCAQFLHTCKAKVIKVTPQMK